MQDLVDAATQTDIDSTCTSTSTCEAQTQTEPNDLHGCNMESEDSDDTVPNWCRYLEYESESNSEYSFEYGLDPENIELLCPDQTCSTPPGWKRFITSKHQHQPKLQKSLQRN